MTLLVRAVQSADLDHVYAVMKENMLGYYKQRKEPWNEKVIRHFFADLSGAVVEHKSGLAAFSFYEVHPNRLHIHTFQVAAEHQNRLTGGCLFKWYLELARVLAVGSISCAVYEQNPALALYLRLGFEERERQAGVVHLSLAVGDPYELR